LSSASSLVSENLVKRCSLSAMNFRTWSNPCAIVAVSVPSAATTMFEFIARNSSYFIYEPPVRKGGLKERNWFWFENWKPLDEKFGLNDWIVELDAGELITGWLTCNGAGLFACENRMYPAAKLNNAAMVK
jgi:hypothetical protein